MSPRPPAFFIADSLGLDFLNSIATPVDQPIDWLDGGDGFVAWLAQADLVPPQALNALVKQATPANWIRSPTRRALYANGSGVSCGKHMGRPLTPKAIRELSPLNALLESDEIYSRVAAHQDSNGDHLELQTTRRWRSPESLLLPIGEALARCVCDEAFADIRACEGHHCTLIFADHTRRRGRRWCSMAMCGNRAKQAAHRHRVKAERWPLPPISGPDRRIR